MLLKLVSILAVFTLMLVACSDSGKETSKATKDNSSDKPKTVEITDAHGKVTVPVNPKNVVALDNRTFETLADWGIKLAAAPRMSCLLIQHIKRMKKFKISGITVNQILKLSQLQTLTL